MKFTVSLAGVPIGVESMFDEVYHLCRDYLTDEAPRFTVAVTPADVAFEREKSRREALLEGRFPEAFSDAYLETLAVYRQIAVGLLPRDIFLFHGSVVAVDGAAYLFTALSGTGKTTHTELWLRHVPGSFIVNGDKPLLRVTEGGVLSCGTPWAGKEGKNRNCMTPLAAIAGARKNERNRGNHLFGGFFCAAPAELSAPGAGGHAEDAGAAETSGKFVAFLSAAV